MILKALCIGLCLRLCLDYFMGQTFDCILTDVCQSLHCLSVISVVFVLIFKQLTI